MAIPGQPDAALRKFEDALYLELCRQHHRVDMFVSSKADEISRRLGMSPSPPPRPTMHSGALLNLTDSRHLPPARSPLQHHRPLDRPLSRRPVRQHFLQASAQVCQVRARAAALRRRRPRPVQVRQRADHRLPQDHQEVQGTLVHRLQPPTPPAQASQHLTTAQKWTGSTTLGTRFGEDVLSSRKSFTRRDFSPLQRRHDDILSHLREAQPQLSDLASTSSDDQHSLSPARPRGAPRLPSVSETSQVTYWNEYEDGSEGGGGWGPEDDYAIYIDPNDDTSFPGLAYVQAILTLPYQTAKAWFGPRATPEQQALLAENRARRGYSSTTTNTNSDSEEEGYASSDAFPSYGYSAFYALPSVSEQKVTRYRENVLLWGTIGSYATSFLLIAIASVLLSTGRHKLRVEVDAGVTLGVVASLFCACAGLGMMLYRRDALSLSYRIVVWGVFVAAFLLNAMLLILVLGSAG